MNKELKEAIETMKHWLKYEKKNKKKINKAEELIAIQETVLKELERLQKENNKLERANKTYINSIQSITPVLLEDYIVKEKIREKIEELKLSGGSNEKDLVENKARELVIEILEELLGEK